MTASVGAGDPDPPPWTLGLLPSPPVPAEHIVTCRLRLNPPGQCLVLEVGRSQTPFLSPPRPQAGSIRPRTRVRHLPRWPEHQVLMHGGLREMNTWLWLPPGREPLEAQGLSHLALCPYWEHAMHSQQTRRWDESQLNQEGLPDTVGGAQSQNFNASQNFRARPREGGNRDTAI